MAITSPTGLCTQIITAESTPYSHEHWTPYGTICKNQTALTLNNSIWGYLDSPMNFRLSSDASTKLSSFKVERLETHEPLTLVNGNSIVTVPTSGISQNIQVGVARNTITSATQILNQEPLFTYDLVQLTLYIRPEYVLTNFHQNDQSVDQNDNRSEIWLYRSNIHALVYKHRKLTTYDYITAPMSNIQKGAGLRIALYNPQGTSYEYTVQINSFRCNMPYDRTITLNRSSYYEIMYLGPNSSLNLTITPPDHYEIVNSSGVATTLPTTVGASDTMTYIYIKQR